MKEFVFDLQRFTAIRAFASAARAVGSSATKIAEPDGPAIFVGDLYASGKALIKDFNSGNVSAGIFETFNGILSSFDFITSKLKNLNIPFLSLASSMAKFEAVIQRAQKEKPLSADTRDELVTNFIDFIGEGVKTATFFVIPGGVVARFLASEAFGILGVVGKLKVNNDRSK